jgi:hypothetical protein
MVFAVGVFSGATSSGVYYSLFCLEWYLFLVVFGKFSMLDIGLKTAILDIVDISHLWFRAFFFQIN